MQNQTPALPQIEPTPSKWRFKLGFQSLTEFKNTVKRIVSNVSAETFGWIASMILICSTVPTFLTFMSGLSSALPPVDLILLIWSSLMLLFIKAAVQKDMLNIVTIGLGFLAQAAMMALMFFH